MKVQVRGEPGCMVQVSSSGFWENQRFPGRTQCTNGWLKGYFIYPDRYLHIPDCSRTRVVSLNYETDIVVAYGRE